MLLNSVSMPKPPPLESLSSLKFGLGACQKNRSEAQWFLLRQSVHLIEVLACFSKTLPHILRRTSTSHICSNLMQVKNKCYLERVHVYPVSSPRLRKLTLPTLHYKKRENRQTWLIIVAALFKLTFLSLRIISDSITCQATTHHFNSTFGKTSTDVATSNELQSVKDSDAECPYILEKSQFYCLG